MNIKPLSDHIVLKAIKEEKNKSGILLPDTADEEKKEQGEVIAVGPGKLDKDGNRQPLEVKVGDKVIFKSYGPTEVKLGDEEYMIAEQDDILGIIE
jgi:chaperonin GroES